MEQKVNGDKHLGFRCVADPSLMGTTPVIKAADLFHEQLDQLAPD